MTHHTSKATIEKIIEQAPGEESDAVGAALNETEMETVIPIILITSDEYERGLELL